MIGRRLIKKWLDRIDKMIGMIKSWKERQEYVLDMMK